MGPCSFNVFPLRLWWVSSPVLQTSCLYFSGVWILRLCKNFTNYIIHNGQCSFATSQNRFIPLLGEPTHRTPSPFGCQMRSERSASETGNIPRTAYKETHNKVFRHLVESNPADFALVTFWYRAMEYARLPRHATLTTKMSFSATSWLSHW